MLGCYNVKNKVIVIIGALGLLGTLYSEGFSAEGAHIVVVDIDGEQCLRRARELGEKYSTNPLGISCDITDRTQVESMVKDVIATHQHIDVLINNAATQTEGFFTPLEEYCTEDWEKVMGVNVTGMFHCCQAVAREMMKRKSGVIINMASIYGVTAPDQRIYEGAEYRGKKINTPLVYSTSKGAVISLTRYLATYLAGYGIRVNAVTSGGVYSGQNETFVRRYSEKCPMARMAKPEEVFYAVYFLACDASSYVTGHNLVVDGGWTIW